MIHRYDPQPIIDKQTGAILGYKQSNESSETLIRKVAACLRLIRPMRQSALLMRGEIRGDGTFDVTGYDVPPHHLIEVPDIQKLFKLRNQDADDLRTYASVFARHEGTVLEILYGRPVSRSGTLSAARLES